MAGIPGEAIRLRARCALMLGIWAAALSAGTPGAARIGIYHWGGRYPHSVADGVDAIAGLGGHVARVALSPNYYRDYNIAPDCRPDFSLTAAAQDPDMRRAFGNPAIDVLILTTYDGTTWGDCEGLNFLDPAFFTPAHMAAVAQEYSDFTLYLYRTYRDTHKRFVVSNWESDNSVYCGDAYRFAREAAFRAACRSQYPASLGIASPEDGLRGLKLWFQARAQGIVEGRNRAQSENIGGMRVYIAPEFSIVRALRDRGFQSVLYDVLPSVMFDYVSYSAWESINTPDPANTLRADLETIQNVTGSSAIIVGESGSRRDRNGREVDLTSKILSAALEWGVAYFIQWQLYDQDPANTYGLYDLEGRATPLAEWFRIRFQQDAPAFSASQNHPETGAWRRPPSRDPGSYSH
ncbi:MAG: hypothetical protein M1541_11845 [Acidobacteria bacterium]|nr:hypothetical protein [Acidobacteriota bacterium]